MKIWLYLFLALALSLAAQDGGAESPPPRPEGRILDEARFFKLEPEALKALSTRLDAFSERTGYEAYVAIFDSLIGSSVAEQSRTLQEAWIGGEPGVVMVLESDSMNYALGWSRRPDAVSESGERVPVLGEDELAPQEKVRIINELVRLSAAEDGSELSVDALVGSFVENLELAFQSSDVSTGPRWRLRVLVLGTGLLAAMLLIGLLVGAWIRRSDNKVDERLIFPKVTVGMRLGAQLGGGKISSRSFDVLPRGEP